MTNNSLNESYPFELNFPFIYDYPNQYNQIEIKDKWTLLPSFIYKTKTNSSQTDCMRIVLFMHVKTHK